LTRWQGEQDRLAEIEVADALAFYLGVPEAQRRVEMVDAFPGVEIEDA